MHEDKTHHQSGTGSVQRSQKEGSGRAKEDRLKTLRKERMAIKEGHTTGGYCDTEALHAKEKEIWKVLSEDLAAAKEKHGYSADPKFKHPEIRALELEINGLSWKPQLVVAADQ